MLNLRKLSVLAIAALLVTGISGISGFAATARTPATTTSLPLPITCLTSVSLTDLVTCLINSVGDDAFSTADLSTLVNPITISSTTWQRHYVIMASPSGSGTSTQHYGPYTSSSPDSGTCGNDWANDTFDRHFTVFQNKNDGSLLVVEQFKDGSFVTPAPLGDPARTPNGPSPGACQNSATPQGTVNDGVTGNLHGYFVVPLPPGTTQTSFDSSCVSGSPSTPCTTTGFINSHFSGSCYPVTCTVTTFFDHYVAPSQSLIENEWKNASADRGGNSGDIRSANI